MADKVPHGSPNALSSPQVEIAHPGASVQPPDEEVADALRLHISPFRQAMRRFARNRLAVVSGALIIGLLITTCIAQWLPLIDPTLTDAANTDAWPGGQHLLGTDSNGHDLFSAMIYGLRPAFVVGIVGALITTVLGVAIGVVAAFRGGWVDMVLSRFTDLIFAFPALVLALLAEALFTNANSPVSAALGDQARVVIMTVVFALLGWPPLMRFVRGLTLQYKEMQFVEAARALGLSDWRIVRRHILPNTWGLVLVQSTFQVAGFIYTEIVLSVLGLGVQAPTPDLGYLADQALGQLEVNWVETIAPSALLTILIVAIAFLGDGLRDAFDPQTKM